MKRFIPYFLLSLFSIVFVYETVEMFITDHSVCHLDFESGEKEKEKESEKSEKNEKKEAKSEFEEELYLSQLSGLYTFHQITSTLFTNHMKCSTSYKKAVYSPPELSPVLS